VISIMINNSRAVKLILLERTVKNTVQNVNAVKHCILIVNASDLLSVTYKIGQIIKCCLRGRIDC